MIRDFNNPEYKKWRKAIYARDKFHCQWPYCNKKNQLNAHHIKKWSDYPALRFNINNGITLCKYHHKFIHGMEDIYEAIFLKILANDRL